jgi:D-glycero-alpha-D-manno-heptose-7-phosphate kinase
LEAAVIVTKTPLRISFVGGGSDLPSFYREEPGAVVSATIDKYIYVAVNEQFEGRVLAHYRATEDVAYAGDLRHDRMRACLLSAGIDHAIEITSMADVPGNTGLGGSSAFTVGLLQALRPGATPESYAVHAYQIEARDCGAAIGKQDHYAAAFGGLNLYRFLPNEVVKVIPILHDPDALNSHLLLLYTGQAREGDAGQVLAGQRQRHDAVRTLVNLALDFGDALQHGNFEHCGGLLHLAWNVKREFASTSQIDAWYSAARQAGAWGGKLCGAGGGGFMLFLAPPERHAAIVGALGLRHVPIRIVPHGSQVVL